MSLLFGFDINECIEEISNMETGCRVSFQKSSIIGYADGPLILAPSAQGLQISIDKIGRMLRNFCLNINTDAFVYILFRHSKGVFF